MKIVFLISRLNYYRFFTPLIKEGLRRGLNVECWHDYSQPKTGKKGHSFPEIKKSPVFEGPNQPKMMAFCGNEELSKRLQGDKEIDTVFSIHMPGYEFKRDIINNFHFRWATIMTGADTFFEFPQAFKEVPHTHEKEIFFVFSENWIEKGTAYLNKFYPQHSKFLANDVKCEITGNAEFDTLSGIDKEAVRKKYGIPEGRSILLYLPFPYDNRAKGSSWERAFCGMFTNTAKTKDGVYLHNRKRNPIQDFMVKAYSLYRIAGDHYARQYWFKGYSEKAVFKACRDFCDKNNLFLVVKPRLKFSVAEIVKNKADLVVWDDETQQDPPVLKELLQLTRMTVSFFSSSVLTSVAAGVYHLNIKLPSVFFENDRQRFWISDEEGTHFNFKGVCESWNIEDVIKNLRNTPLSDFTISQDGRYKYISKYLGFDDYKSSQRVFDALNNPKK